MAGPRSRAGASAPSRPRRARGFTLLELTIVVAILGVIATIAFPRFGAMIRSANEKASLGRLGTLRSALSLYYVDTEGMYPGDLTPLTQPGSKYMSGGFSIYTGGHGNSSVVEVLPAKDLTRDTGTLGYVSAGDDPGAVWVQCTHTDMKGLVWNSY